MPPMTKAQFEEIKALVATREPSKIEQAKRLLRGIDDDRARSMLATLEERFPTPARTPITSAKKGPAKAPADDLDEVRRLIAQKRFDEAETLLWKSNAPEAGDLLKKIALVRGAQPATRATSTAPAVAPISGFQVKAKDKPKTSSGMVAFAAVVGTLFVLGVIAVGVILFQQQKEKEEKPGKIYLQLYGVCYYLALDEHDLSEYQSEDMLTAACELTAEEFMTNYPSTAEYCYDHTAGVKDYVGWFGCDAENSDKLNVQYIVAAMR